MGASTDSAEPGEHKVYAFSDLTMDIGQRRLWRGNKQIALSKLSFALLRLLVERAPYLVTHDECAAFAWGPKRVVTPENLSQRITKLRQALGDDSGDPRYVESVRGEGYRLIPPVADGPGGQVPDQAAKRVRRRLSIRPYVLLALAVAVASALWALSDLRNPRPVPVILAQTVDGGLKNNAQLSPDGQLLAFDWTPAGESNRDIYVRAVGENTRMLRITDSPTYDVRPVWSPDGRELAFLRITDGRAGIYVLPSLGGREEKVAEIRGPIQFANRLVPSLSWSPDGRYLAFAERSELARPAAVAVLDLHSLEKKIVSSPVGGMDAIGDLSPAFSPDGRRIAFVRGPSIWTGLDVWVMNADGSDARRVTTMEWAYCEDVQWADARHLVFTAGDLFSRVAYLVDTQDGTPRPIAGLGVNDRVSSVVGDRLAFTRVDAEPPNIWRTPGRLAATDASVASDLMIDGADKSYSPIGDRIAFQSQRLGRAQIWIAEVDGTNPEILSHMRTAALRPRWAPDARTLVFESYDSGNADVYSLDLVSARIEQLTSWDSDEFNATISRDGQMLYFSSNRTGSHQIFRQPIAGGEAEQMTSEGGFYGIESHDGHHLYFARRQNGGGLWGLWRVPLTGGAEELVFDQPALPTGLSWDLSPGGVYYEVSEEDAYAIYYRDLQSAETIKIYDEKGPFARFWLAVSPDEAWVLFSRHRVPSAELFVLDNYR